MVGASFVSLTPRSRLNSHLNGSMTTFNSEICPTQLCIQPPTKIRSRQGERMQTSFTTEIPLFRKKKRYTRCCCYKKFLKYKLMEQDIFGRHFVCYFAHASVKRTWAQVSYQPITQKSPLIIIVIIIIIIIIVIIVI